MIATNEQVDHVLALAFILPFALLFWGVSK